MPVSLDVVDNDRDCVELGETVGLGVPLELAVAVTVCDCDWLEVMDWDGVFVDDCVCVRVKLDVPEDEGDCV